MAVMLILKKQKIDLYHLHTDTVSQSKIQQGITAFVQLNVELTYTGLTLLSIFNSKLRLGKR